MRTLIPCSALLALLAAAPPLRGQDAPVRVVVNALNPATQVSRELAQRLFLKQTTSWSNGSAVLVVDQAERSPVRRAFSHLVLRRDVPEVKSYWQRLVFSGRAIAPAEKPSDADVLAFIRANPGAIGYVSAGAELGSGVKTLGVLGN